MKHFFTAAAVIVAITIMGTVAIVEQGKTQRIEISCRAMLPECGVDLPDPIILNKPDVL